MTEPAKESDALTIARWCWPERPWVEWGDGKQAYEVTGRLDAQGNHIGAGTWWPRDFEFERDSIADAERILIERGHAEAYARQVARALYPDEEAWLNGGRFAVVTTWEILGALISAPLDARVRAMSAVIRGLP